MSIATVLPPKASTREFIRKGQPPTEDYRELLFELEAKGELEVQRVPGPYVEVETKYGRKNDTIWTLGVGIAVLTAKCDTHNVNISVKMLRA